MDLQKTVFFLTLIFLLANCSTVGEVMSPNDSAFGYERKNDGSTKYVRERVISKRSNGLGHIHDHSYNHNHNHNAYTYDNDSYQRPSSLEYLMINQLASSASQSSLPSGISLGISNSIAEKDSNVHFGLEAEVPLLYGWLVARTGLSFFKSDYLYIGGTLGARLTNPHWKLSPYVGVEAYIGDHKRCDYRPRDHATLIETCEKVFLTTLYSEAGLRWKFSEKVKLYLFTRGYSKVDQTIREDLAMFYGGSLFFTY